MRGPAGGRAARLLAALLLVQGAAAAQSIHDAGIIEARARTELEPGVGSASLPLELSYTQAGAEGCLWNAQDSFSGCPGRAGLPALPGGAPVWAGTLQGREACGGSMTRVGDSWIGCTIYDSSPYFAVNDPGDTYWTLVANDDPSFEQCNEGPPGLSHPLASASTQQATPFKFDVLRSAPPARGGQRLRMILSLTDKDFFCHKMGAYQYSIPFLSVGAQQGRGNPGPVGYISRFGSPRGTIVFRARLSSYQTPGCKPGTASICTPAGAGVHVGMYALTRVAGVPYLVFLDLFSQGVADYSAYAPGASRWNWPVQESFFFPGASVLSLVAGTQLSTYCGINLPRYGTDLAWRRYQIDFGALLGCAERLGLLDGPLPEDEFALEGVHWFIEGVGTRGELGNELSAIETAIFVHGFDQARP